MNRLLIGFILLLLQSSCCSTKTINHNSNKEIAEVIVAESPDIPEPPKVPEPPIPPKAIEDSKPAFPESENLEISDQGPIIEPNVETTAIKSESFNHDSWHDLLQNYVSSNGKVNYQGFKKDRVALRNYITSLGENMPSNNWSKEDKIAFWINAYNAMTVDLIIRNYPIKSIKDIDKPWEQRLWKLDSKWYNLNEIEHQILRKMNEPRIHFGIVCASFSCPKLLNSAFTATNLDADLTKVTKEFLTDSNRNNISKDTIKISKIFQWFAKDFKQNGSLIDFLNLYSDIEISKNAKRSFKDYKWDLND